MNYHAKHTLRNLAAALLTCGDVNTCAAVLDALLCVTDEAGLTNDEIEAGETFFGILSQMCPEAVEVAQNGMTR